MGCRERVNSPWSSRETSRRRETSSRDELLHAGHRPRCFLGVLQLPLVPRTVEPPAKEIEPSLQRGKQIPQIVRQHRDHLIGCLSPGVFRRRPPHGFGDLRPVGDHPHPVGSCLEEALLLGREAIRLRRLCHQHPLDGAVYAQRHSQDGLHPERLLHPTGDVRIAACITRAEDLTRLIDKGGPLPIGQGNTAEPGLMLEPAHRRVARSQSHKSVGRGIVHEGVDLVRSHRHRHLIARLVECVLEGHGLDGEQPLQGVLQGNVALSLTGRGAVQTGPHHGIAQHFHHLQHRDIKGLRQPDKGRNGRHAVLTVL